MELGAIISGFTNNSDASFDWVVSGIPTGATLSTATFKVKLNETDPDSAILITKSITSSNQVGIGQIEDTGADTIGKIRFDLTPTDTGQLIPGTKYVYWVYITLNTGEKSCLEKGIIFSEQGDTHA